jgi:hypothetical protein
MYTTPQGVEMFTFIGSLWCVGFIKPIGVVGSLLSNKRQDDRECPEL